MKNTRDEFLLVHDVNIKRWALESGKDVSFNHFKASDSWINDF